MRIILSRLVAIVGLRAHSVNKSPQYSLPLPLQGSDWLYPTRNPGIIFIVWYKDWFTPGFAIFAPACYYTIFIKIN
jgi:hypothetical protein